MDARPDFILRDAASESDVPNWLLKERLGVIAELSLAQSGVYGTAGVGGVVWDSAILLARLMQMNKLPGIAGGTVRGLNVLELGCGTGAGGLAAAVYGASSVVLTDLPNTLDITRDNVGRNMAKFDKSCRVTVVEANWDIKGSVASAARGVDLVISADCVYEGENGMTTDSFLNALEEALSPGTKGVVVYKKLRTGMQQGVVHFEQAIQLRFLVTEVSIAELPREFQSLGISVLGVQAYPKQAHQE